MTNSLDEAMASQFSGNFLDATDVLSKGTVTLTIANVVGPNVERDATKKLIDKGILSFEKTPKRFIVGKTNFKIVRMHHGKPSEWVGKKITLTVRYLKTAFGQFNVPVLRVVPPDNVPIPFGMRKHYGSDKPFTKQEGDRQPGEE